MDELVERIRQVRLRVADAAARSGRSPDDVTIIAVTKTVPVERVALAYELGLKSFGENRVQEARAKIAALHYPLMHWHLIGHLQTNKVARAVELFDLIHSVDSLRLAEALEHSAAARVREPQARVAEPGEAKRPPPEARERTVAVLLQVNVSGEASKEGVSLDALPALADGALSLPHLRVQGLMTIAPYTARPEEVRPVFRRLRELRDDLRERFPDGAWDALSMGMTNDYVVAIEEGATMVRIGRAIFGERPEAQ
jgi:pyridoxal phosphate enzyme (YggS family)